MKRIGSVLLMACVACATIAAVPSTSSRVDLVGNGATTAFSFTFPANSKDWVEVQLGGVTQTSGYTVTLNANQASSPGGTVTFATPPTTSTAVRIQRTVPLTQTTVYSAYAPFAAKTTEGALDRLLMQVQQVDRKVGDEHSGWSDGIASEATARGAGDSALQNGLNAETAARIQADLDLRTSLSGGGGGGAIGDYSSILATGTTTSRNLRDRFADSVSLKDFGAVLNGTTDERAILQAAVTAMGTTVKRNLVIPGCISVSSGVTIPSNITIQFQGGWSGFTGAGAGAMNFKTPDGEYHIRRDFCVQGEWSDISAALQAAVDVASGVRNAPIVIDPGSYYLYSPIDVKSNVSIRGGGRSFGNAIYLSGNTYAFKIDGSDKSGGWAFRIDIRNLMIDASASTTTNPIIDVNWAYNVVLSNIWVYQTKTSGLRARAANDVSVDELIVYGRTSADLVDGGINIDGTTAPVSIKVTRPDVEVANVGIHTSGVVWADIHNPYVERAVVAFNHQGAWSDGSTTVTGGVLSSVNGYPLSIYGDNFTMIGTELDPYQASSRGGAGIGLPATLLAHNVHLKGIGRLSQTGFADINGDGNTNNWGGVDVDTSYVPNKVHRRWDLRPKTATVATSGTPIQIARFWGVDFADVKVKLWGYKATLDKDALFRIECSFLMSPNGRANTPITCTPLQKVELLPAELSITSITLTGAYNAAGAEYTLSVTPVHAGTLPLTIQGELEADVIDSGPGGIYIYK